MKRSLIFHLHSWAGLLSGLFILLMSVSGALLVFHEELDSLQYPVVNSNAHTPLLPVDSCYRSLQKYFPHAQISNCELAINTDRPFVFTIYDHSYANAEASMQVFLHPQTGELLGTRGGSSDARHNSMAWLGKFHNSFHLGRTGEWLLGFFGSVFLLSLVTGSVLYRRNILAVITFRKTVFRRGNLHQLIGVYALLFNLVIAISGVWMQRYVFRPSFYASRGNYKPVLKISPPLSYSLDSAVGQATKRYPDFTGYVIYFAQSNKAKTAVYGSRSGNAFIHSKKFADLVMFDSTGQIARTAFVTDIDPADRYDIINSQVHFGRYGGWPVKLLYSLLGLSGALLSITGFIFWLRRKKRERY